MLFLPPSRFVDMSLWDISQVRFVLWLAFNIWLYLCCLSILSFSISFHFKLRIVFWVFIVFSRFFHHTMNLAFGWSWLKFIPIASFCLFHEKSISSLRFPLLKHKPSSRQFLPSCFSLPHRFPISLQISVVNICSPLSIPLNFSFPLLVLSL